MDAALRRAETGRFAFDKLGTVIAALAVFALFFRPFALLRANRIAAGEPYPVWAALPAAEAWLLLGPLLAVIALTLLRTPNLLRLACGLLALLLLAIGVGRAAGFLAAEDNPFARVSPASGFWLLVFAFALLVADALARLRPPPLARLGLLALAAAGLAALFASGAWDALSILAEYAVRAEVFWRGARTHVLLAFGSLAAAVVVGVPLGIACHRLPRLRPGVLNGLNIVQTIPSIALFGLLIAPMAWIGANLPGAAALGIAGIGAAPAFVALFAYALLPVVSNTAVGLDAVPRPVADAARGMGMTGRQLLVGVELPLALPVILTGVRIVLVQNIGLAVIAGLIGGGGLGTFVFQGLSQTAMDLVLLGALPTVALAFAAAIALDAVIEISRGGETKR